MIKKHKKTETYDENKQAKTCLANIHVLEKVFFYYFLKLYTDFFCCIFYSDEAFYIMYFFIDHITHVLTLVRQYKSPYNFDTSPYKNRSLDNRFLIHLVSSATL